MKKSGFTKVVPIDSSRLYIVFFLALGAKGQGSWGTTFSSCCKAAQWWGNKNTSQQWENPDEAPSSVKEMTRRVKSQIMSMYSEKQLANPEIQKRLALMDSPAFREFMKDAYATGLNQRKINDFWESQGFRVKRKYPEMFHHSFLPGSRRIMMRRCD